MVLILATLAVLAAGLAWAVNQLRKAPVGYEDEHGFHLVPQVKGSAILRRSRSKAAARAALEAARAH